MTLAVTEINTYPNTTVTRMLQCFNLAHAYIHIDTVMTAGRNFGTVRTQFTRMIDSRPGTISQT